MHQLLVCCPFPLNDCHKAALREIPGCAATFLNGKAPTPEQLAEADFIFGSLNPALLTHCKKLKVLQLQSAGTDGYTADKMPEGCVLTNATGAYGRSVSEHMFAALLTLMKKLHLYRDNQRAERWADEGGVDSIPGSTTLILGLGDIGVHLARQISSLGGYVIGVRRTGADKPDWVDQLYLTEDLDKILPQADVVALCLPSTPATKGILSRERIFSLKKGAYIINAGRGTAIDQDALCDAVEQGHLAGASLDVTDPEPLPAGHRLWKTRGVLLTPHISGGAHMTHTLDTLVGIAVSNFNACLEGKPLRNVVDFATGYRKL